MFLLVALSGTVISDSSATISSTKYYIDGSALVVFDGNVSGAVLSIVLESTLYSQILASHAYDCFSDYTEWYGVIIRSLEEVNWTMYSSDFKLKLDNESSSNQEAVKKQVLADFSEQMKAVICNGLDGIYRNSSLTKLFSQAISMGNISNFQIIVISVDQDGSVMMSYTGFIIYAVDFKLRILYTSSGLGTIKVEDYATYHKDVITTIGTNSRCLITEFKLP